MQRRISALTLASALWVTAMFAGHAQAKPWNEPMITVSLCGTPFQLSAGETRSIYIPDGWRKIEKIFVQAEARGGDSTFEVIANGDTKGTVHVPGTDPSYIVTVNESASSLQFRNISGGAAWVRDVKAVLSERYLPLDDDSLEGHPLPSLICPRHDHCETVADIDYPANSHGAKMALRAIHLIEQLEPYASYREYGEYLLPIKKLAARAYAYASVRDDLSRDVKCALLALKRQIDYATPYINETFERTAAFDSAIALVTLGEELKAAMWP